MGGVMAPVAMTTEELLSLPENGVERWLIRGRLRQRPWRPNDRGHSRATARVSTLLENWRERQPEPRGLVLSGAGVRLQRDPDTTVGADALYLSPEQVARQPAEDFVVEGPPVLAVEVLSPNDILEDTHEKIDAYIQAGVPLVWVLDPFDRTVRIYRPGQGPTLVNAEQELTAEPHLPGFRVAVARLFD
jgi:Uma2 family endonuclease